MKNRRILSPGSLTIFAALCCALSAQGASKVAIAPVSGNAVHPLLFDGIRQIILADLGLTGEFEPVTADLRDFNTEKASAFRDRADIVVSIVVRDQLNRLEAWVRATDTASGYNIGSLKVTGGLNDVRLLQDKIATATLGILRAGIPPARQAEIFKGHVDDPRTLAALGQASARIDRKEYLPALAMLAEARALSPDARAPRALMEKTGSALLDASKAADDRGYAFFYMGRDADAVREFDAALAANAANQKALVGKSTVLSSLGKNAEAEALLLQAQKQDPNNAALPGALARLYGRTGQRAGQLEQLQRSAALGSDDAAVYEGLGDALAQRRQNASAAQAYAKAADLSVAAVNLRNARALYVKANQLSPTADGGLREVDVLIKMGQVDVAIAVLNRMSVARPESDAIRARLGLAFLLANQTDAAIRRFREALEINGRNYEANFYLGVVYDDIIVDDAMAARYLEAAFKIRPDEFEPGMRLAKIYIDQQKSAAAVNLMERLVKLAPNNVELHARLGDAYYAAENYASAELAYAKAAGFVPDLLWAHEGLAKVYVRTGQTDKALASLDRVYAIDAVDNVFVREGEVLLASLTPKVYVDMARRFPKSVPDAQGKAVPVNQTVVLRLRPARSAAEWVRERFAIFILDEKKLRQDVELALFARYRVIRPAKEQDGEIPVPRFENAGEMTALARGAKADGVFGYRVRAFERGAEKDRVKVDMLLHTAVDGGLHGVEDKATIEAAEYPRGRVVILNPRAPLSYLTALLIFLIPLLYFTVYRARRRGWGTVKVILNYDPKMESFLTLKLSTKVEDIKSDQKLIVRDKEKHQKSKYKQFVQQRGAWVKQMVGRETVFERVPARAYHCYLFGTIEDTGLSKKTVGNYSMVQQFTLGKNETRELTFELEKKEAYVIIYVTEGDRYLAGAEIHTSASQEVKFSRGEAGTFFYLPLGDHVVTVRHEGRSYRQKVSVRDLADKNVLFDVQNVDELLAQEEVAEEKIVATAKRMEDQGQLADAAKLLEKAGRADEALDTKAQQHLAEGDALRAAQEYARGREFVKAAKIYAQSGDHAKANVMHGFHYLAQKEYEKALGYLEKTDSYQALASAYRALDREDAYHSAMAKYHLQKGQKIEAAQSLIKAKEYSRAAEIYEELKEPEKAAILFARDGNFSLAANLFAQTGDTLKAAKAFEEGAFYDDAIGLYRETGHKDKVIELLVKAERFTEAAREAKDQGLNDEAIKICQRTPDTHHEYFDSQVLLAQLFFERGMNDLALSTYQQIMKEHSARLDDDALYVYGDLLEAMDQGQAALAVFENILQRNFHFKDVNLRVNDLKGKVAAEARAVPQGMRETIGGADPARPARYEVLGELGRGAMGVVFKAKDRTLDRIVAYKTLPHTLKGDSAALEDLVREAQTAAKLNHPGIVTVYDVGEQDGAYFMAMEYVEGQTLQEILKRYRRVTGANFLHIARALCTVLDFAHQRKVIHRDVKPSNIILTPDKNVKLMDFGLAKILEDLAIDKTMLRGTPLYMAPEQVLGKDIDHRCDIYALGVIFYEMLAKSPPFVEGDIMYAHLHVAPRPLLEAASDVPAHVAQAVMACLEKKKTDRPETARALWQMISTPS